jgi:hypothetical protein
MIQKKLLIITLCVVVSIFIPATDLRAEAGGAQAFRDLNVIGESCGLQYAPHPGGFATYGLAFASKRLGVELGKDSARQFRISEMGPDGDTEFFGWSPAVAYNSTDNEYLVVWWGSDDSETAAGYWNVIFGQRIDASSGAEVGTDDFRISGTEAHNCVLCADTYPGIVYNSTDNEYLVVWWSDIYTGGIGAEYDIFGQRLDAAGNEVGEDDFRISFMGPDGNPDFDATSPAVAYSGAVNGYLVVWDGEDNTGELVVDEFEVYGYLSTLRGHVYIYRVHCQV